MGQASSSLLLFLRILLFFQLLFCSFPIAAAVLQGGSNATDQLALISFKLLLSNDQFGPLASWNDSHAFCHWPGITCSIRHPQRVTSLDLESYDLKGPISPSLANLTFLRRIHLPGNQLHGNIPHELGRLFRLQYLNLSSNSLQGSIPPTLFNSSSLRNVSLRNNQLDGVIPSNLPPLHHMLDLSNNILIGGIPASLGNASGLSYLDLSNNSLVGNIPSSMGKLSSLTLFDLSRNNLTGAMPPSIWNLSHLTKLEVHTNNLSGTIPPDMGNSLPNLQRLLLYENQFGGSIPVSIANASRLEHVQLYYNDFTGTIPWNLGSLENLFTLIIGDNQLDARDARDWRFFTGLPNCTNLQVLDVSDNQLGGVLPDAIANLSTTLTWLGMKGNQFSGDIPPEIANLYRLNQFRINGNLLTEYGMANRVSTQGDVYSYGILLLEMFTGKRPTDHVFSEGLSLHKFVDMAFPGRVIDIVDPHMSLEEEDDEDYDRAPTPSNKTEKIHDCLAAVLKIGLSCTQDLPSERMKTRDVAKEMMAVKVAFLGGGTKAGKRR